MAGGFAVLLGAGYVLSGNLSIPIGIHFGINFVGTNPVSASLFRPTATETVAANLVLPIEIVVLRLAATLCGIIFLLGWYRTDAGRIEVTPTLARPTLRWHSSD